MALVGQAVDPQPPDRGQATGLPGQGMLSVLAVFAAWSTYLPLGLKYVAVLALGTLAWVAWSRGGVRRAEILRRCAVAVPLAGMWLLLLASALWTDAPARLVAGHLGIYGLVLLLPGIAAACPPAAARRALAHFAAASGLVGVLFIVRAAGWLPPSPLWALTIDDDGNQRICNSILLALGCTTALWQAATHRSTTGPAPSWLPTGAWLLTAALAATGLALQDRRTGMLVLPLLLLAWALARSSRPLQRWALVGALAVCTALVWQTSDVVRQRFAEGWSELRQYTGDDTVTTSWGQRLRLLEVTATMVAERPVLGTGVASWDAHWRQRVRAGSVVADNRTPHNEYLHLAQQAGVATAGLLMWAVVAGMRAGVRAGLIGTPALMAWLTLGFSGAFNAVLRDAKFALPLIVLCALALAAARPIRRGTAVPCGRNGASR